MKDLPNFFSNEHEFIQILKDIQTKFNPKLKKVWNDAGISTEKLPKTALEHFFQPLDNLIN